MAIVGGVAITLLANALLKYLERDVRIEIPPGATSLVGERLSVWVTVVEVLVVVGLAVELVEGKLELGNHPVGLVAPGLAVQANGGFPC